MGKMTVRIDADVDGKKFDFTFKWEGDDEAIENTMRFIEEIADKAGASPDAFAHSTLRYLPKTGLMNEPGAQDAQMKAILYAVLQIPTGSPDRPGAVYNYAATESIDATLTVRNDGIHADIKGRFLGH